MRHVYAHHLMSRLVRPARELLRKHRRGAVAIRAPLQNHYSHRFTPLLIDASDECAEDGLTQTRAPNAHAVMR